MSDPIKAVEAVAASGGRGLAVVAGARGAGADDRNSGNTNPGDRSSAADADSVRRAVADVAAGLQKSSHLDLTYRVDSELHRVIVEVVDRRDGSVLRQIPGEEVLRLARMMQEGHGRILEAIA
ncbi:MAG: flagellar protein FlaG [Solimonas sp.]